MLGVFYKNRKNQQTIKIISTKHRTGLDDFVMSLVPE